MSPTGLRLMLFTVDPGLARAAVEAGVNGLVVDWETSGKKERQLGADTEINEDSPEALDRLASLGAPHLVCRVDRPGPETTAQVERALAGGATDLLLPMVRHPAEVEDFLRAIDGRARAGILVETVEAVDRASELARLPLDWVYLGLNDLAISRGGSFLFEPLIDGTADRVRAAFPETCFGVAGVTDPGAGAPIPCSRLLAEMARLDVGFSFLRRSFKRDVGADGYAAALAAIRRVWGELGARSTAEVDADRKAFVSLIERLALTSESKPVR